MKKTTKDQSGTSYYGHTVSCTPNELIKLLGNPQYDDNQGYDKVNLNWICELSDGRIFTIYDWKEYKQLDMNTQVHWHIGGHDENVTLEAKTELEHALKN